MSRTIFHIDVNSAFLSWTAVEQLKQDTAVDIRTIPAIIGGDQEARRGVVLAKSLPAKQYGIRTGEPVANAVRKCPNLRIERPDHMLYEHYSHSLMEFLHTYTPDIEQVSVDECYLDFTGISHRYTSPIDGAIEIKNTIKNMFGFTVNVGIATNKLLAKMASDFEKPDKIHTLFPEEIVVKMWPLPVGELYMAGRASVETLKKLDIQTIGELANADPGILELHLKSHGRMLWEFANGIENSPVVTKPAKAKGIGNSTTLPKDARTKEEAAHILLELAQSVGARLRRAGQKAGMVSVEIKYFNFETASHQKQLIRATNSDTILYEAANALFGELWNQEPVRLLGIRSSKLVPSDEPEQLTIFDIPLQGESNDQTETRQYKSQYAHKQKQLNQALDEIRRKYGAEAVMRGSHMKKSD